MIYLDNAATTPVLSLVLNEMERWYESSRVGNPSSIHTNGQKAKKAIEEARCQVAHLINADPSEIFFTSGGTESNNAWTCSIRKPVVITTPIEHHSNLESLKNRFILNPDTFTYSPVDVKFTDVLSTGVVDLDVLERLLKRYENRLGAISIMWANNELGSINPIHSIGELCREHNVFFHSDAVAAVGHINIDVKEDYVDALSISGHKFGAPQGIGALYLSKRVPRNAWLYGGSQESGLRGGTENVAGIIGLGVAADMAKATLPNNSLKFRSLRRAFLGILNNEIPTGFAVNGGSLVVPNIISLYISGINSHSLLLFLDQRGIAVSTGSACSSGTYSHVLQGIGMTKSSASNVIRISMGFDTTENDMVCAAKAIVDGVRFLKSI